MAGAMGTGDAAITFNADELSGLTALRHDLHRHPEISGQEAQTAARIVAELTACGADRIWTDLGGHGVAAEFTGTSPGPTVMIRCELDALPIPEISRLSYRSEVPGSSHACGHDGHMSMVIGVARFLARRPKRGRVVLLFQPAEETGMGAPAVVADPAWPEIRPDYAFAIHNLPGMPLGQVGLCTGATCCASRGMKVQLTGKSSHAAAPEDGVSPGPALAQLMTELPNCGRGGALTEDFKLATLTHCRLGEATFGIAPGHAELRCTLRAVTDRGMQDLIHTAEHCVEVAAKANAVQAEVTWHDVFAATVNSAAATDLVRAAASLQGLALADLSVPARFSEDFACYGLDGAEAAMLFLGSGETQPQLHNPDFDFPDALLPLGAGLFAALIEQVLNA